MQAEGLATLWCRNLDGNDVTGHEASMAEQEKLVTILNVETEHGSLQLVFRRGEFSKLMAHPNNGYEIDVALNMEEA